MTVKQEIYDERHYIIRSYMSSCMAFLNTEDRSKMPSSISVLPLSYNCPRRRFIKYQETKTEHHNLRTINNFLKGRLYHTIPVFRDGETELELIWEGIVGHPDDYCPTRQLLVDKKFSENPPKKSKYGWEDPFGDPPMARPHDQKQVQYYRVLMEEGHHFDGTPSNRRVKRAYVMYKKPSDTEFQAMATEVELPNIEATKKEMRFRRDEYLSAIQTNTIPNGELGWPCKYCDYYNICMDKAYIAKREWSDNWL